VYRSSWPPEVFDVASRIRRPRKIKNMTVFLSVKSTFSRGQAERCACRQFRLLRAFQEEPLRFEGHSWVQTQNCSRSQAIALNDYPRTAHLAWNSAVPSRCNSHPAHSRETRRNLRQERWTSKLRRAIRANYNFECRAPAELHGARCPLRGNLRLLWPTQWLPRNS